MCRICRKITINGLFLYNQWIFFIQNGCYTDMNSALDPYDSVIIIEIVVCFLFQVAFPHVMHSCAALLENRKHYNPGAKFSNSETKLLYTLHWIILDAASECEDNSTVHDTTKPVASVQLHTLKSIQLFVYLFAPLVNTLEDSDFQSLKLENGLRIWQPMWDYQQPDIPCFSTPVKPQRNILKAQRNLLKVNTNAANIYIGKGTSRENLNLILGFDAVSLHSSDSSPSPTRLAPLARLSDSEFCFMSQSETQSVSYVCEYCNAVRSNRSGEAPNICKCGRKDSFVAIGSDTKHGLLDRLGSLDRDFMKTRLASAVASGVKGQTSPDILSASHFDVAVLQCLFCLQWSEDGVLWALKYVHHRLLEICDEYVRLDLSERERSQSLPFADPKILRSNSVPKSSINKGGKEGTPPGKSTAEGSGMKTKPASMSPGLSTIASDSEPPSNPSSPISQPFLSGLRKEPPFKKVCMVELRQYPDSTRAVVTRKEPPKGDTSPQHIIPFKTKLDQYALPTVERDAASGLYKWNFEPGRSPTDSLARSPSDRGNKMELSWASGAERSVSPITKFNFPPPSDQEYETSSHSSNESSISSQFMESSQVAKNSAVTRPIITITQETPQRTQQSWPTRYAYIRDQSPTGEGCFEREHPSLSRSMTDSHITYQPDEEVHEVPGAVHYIQKNGRLNYKVILQVCQSSYSYC